MKYPWNERYLATMESGRVEDATIVGVSGPHFMARTSSVILVGQRSDLPDGIGASGQTAKVFATPWPEPGAQPANTPQAGPSPGP
jgi:hypothetical protein